MATLIDIDHSITEEDGETVIELNRTYSANDLMQYVPPGANNGDENRVADFIYDEMLNDMGFVFRCLYGAGSFPEVDGYDLFHWDWKITGCNVLVTAEVRLDLDAVELLKNYAKQWKREE